MSNDNIAFMKSEDCRRVSKSEFMQSFDDWDEWLREHNHLGIIDCAKDFLELEHRAKKKKLGMSKNRLKTFGE